MKKDKALKILGSQIRQIREEKGLTPDELASSIGKHRPAINRLEMGHVNPSMYFIREIAGGLGMKLDELLKGLNSL